MAKPPDDDPLGRFVVPGAVVLVGETHGTHELPAVVARLAALASGRGLPVAVALEVPSSEQPALDAFFARPDDPAARTALTASAFWHPPPGFDDGRAGRGMLRLLRALHRTAQRGTVAVRAVDLPWIEEATAVPDDVVALLARRDAVMADVAAAAFAPVATDGGVAILLAGNVHTRVRRRSPFGPAPLGACLTQRFPELVALQGHWSGGTCRAMGREPGEPVPRGARVLRLSPSPTAPGSAGLWTRAREVSRTGHHGWVNVGHLTPSSPLPAPHPGPEPTPARPGAQGSPGARIDP
ncbi:hypothetical protein [Kineosporia sp. A_224]|uniref:hypothetical protein n=1 Tax=Kineosporia sp. A_224 TaxID=1962180 RepID=UPI000B4BD65F|nr:hypothetical protein [Kineosporia sp. A_224]